MNETFSKLTLLDANLLQERAYWISRLSSVAEFPHLFPNVLAVERPNMQAGTVLELSQEWQQKLDKLTAGSSFLCYTTLVAALKVCLFRYIESNPIIVGSPLPTNEHASCSDANVVALLDIVDDSLTFQEFLLNVRKTLQEAYARPNYPFQRLIQDMIQDEQADNRCPLFDVLLVLQGFHGQVPPINNDITILCDKNSDETLRISVTFNANVMERAYVDWLVRHFVQVLQCALENLNQRIGDIDMTSDAERHQLCTEWNATYVAYDTCTLVHTRFEQHASRAPDMLALVCEEHHLSYEAVNVRAHALAAYLQAHGIGPGMMVGVCLDRSLEMVIGWLGVLKAGAAYVPLDPAYPAERLQFMLNNAQISLVLTQDRLRACCVSPQQERAVLCLDTDWLAIAPYATANLSFHVNPANLAYVIYTSGSTGTPKGVAVSHQSLLNLISWHQRVYRVNSDERATLLASSAFDAAVWELWPYLAAGACVLMADDNIRLSPVPLYDWMIERAITLSFVVTSLAERLIELDWSNGSALRALLTGGDRLHSYAPEGLPYPLINHYGPTESTVVASSALVPPKRGASSFPSIGRCIDNIECYIVTPSLQLAPVGVPGELYIGGAGLAQGYVGRADLTAERFLPHPFSAQPGARLYRTGDRVRYQSDGELEFLGRSDRQVKLRGVRIELGEIEVMLREHSLVREAVVLAQDHAPGELRLVAYLVMRSPFLARSDAIENADSQAVQEGDGNGEARWKTYGTEALHGELRRFLQEKLPVYMLPAAFVVLDAFPLTSNGKVDRQALSQLPIDWSHPGRAYVAPRTALEEVIVGLWSEVLSVERIGVEDNFFELGGHSLLAIQLISRFRDAFDQELPLRKLFEEPTVAGIARALIEAVGDADEVEQTAHMLLQLAYLSDDEIEL
jgi:amino acid adenylation domain-containing protein